MKWLGKCGFAVSQNNHGIWIDEVVEKRYSGDLIKKRYDIQSGPDVNNDITINNQISILADKFMYENFQCIKYVEVLGTRWKVKSVEVQYPRLLLTLGGIWNGESDSEEE